MLEYTQNFKSQCIYNSKLDHKSSASTTKNNTKIAIFKQKINKLKNFFIQGLRAIRLKFVKIRIK